MKISIETNAYNDRRYGKPWIALVDFLGNKNGNFKFGDWVGQNGYAGVLEVEANVCDIVARGQKDNRKPSNFLPDFYVVTANGELESVSKVDVYKCWNENQNEDNPILQFSDEQLLSEIKRRGLI